MHNDLQTLRHLLSQVVRAAGKRRRELEECLEIGHGNLERIFDGRVDLRVRHIMAVAKLLGVRPGQLIDLGCPEITGAAWRDVEDILAPGRHATAAGLAEQKARDRQELIALIDQSVRRALEQSGLRRPDAPPDGRPPE
jgi:hypothetical protein